jgi:hypothetical protein
MLPYDLTLFLTSPPMKSLAPILAHLSKQSFTSPLGYSFGFRRLEDSGCWIFNPVSLTYYFQAKNPVSG